MTLIRNERSAALAYLLKQDYAAFGRLIEDTTNLTREQKIDLLSSALQLAAPGARISYGEEARRVIDDLVSIINAEPDRKLEAI
ncbi:MAG: hypothetical protein J2P16_07205 [Mycobacterium sp.]|nr:hypothetical protein [Mycobacterium sp.]